MSQYDRTETVHLQIIATSNKAKSELVSLEQEYKKLSAEQAALTRNTKQWLANRAKLKDMEAKMGGLRKEIGLSSLSMKQLRKHARALKQQMDAMTPETADWKRLNSELQKTRKRMRDLNSGLGPMGRAWKGVTGHLKGFYLQLLSLASIGGIAALFRGMWQGAIKLADGFADVRKTTNLTRKEMRELNKDLGQIDTRTPRKRLLELAKEAGRLGIEGTKSISEFVESADKLEVALGEDLGEDAILQVAKLNGLWKVDKVKGYGKAMEATGSAINSLAQNGKALEANIVNWTTRLGGVAPQAQISIDKILGLASASDELGQKVEKSSTAVMNTITAMYTDTATFAEIANMSVDDFTEMLNKDANEALLAFLDGLNGNNEGLGQMAIKLDSAEMSGSRVVGVLSALAGNTDLIRRSQKLANEEFEKGTSVLNEFAIKNDNAAGKWAKWTRWLNKKFVSSAFMDSVNKLLGAMVDLTKVPVSEKLEEQRVELQKLGQQVLRTNKGTQARVNLIKKMKEMYPGLLKHLDAEKSSNEEIRVALHNVNKELLNKIVLQRKDEELQKQREKTADQIEKIVDQMDDLAERAAKFQDEGYLVPEFSPGKVYREMFDFYDRLGGLGVLQEHQKDESIQNMHAALTQYKEMVREIEKVDREAAKGRSTAFDRGRLFNPKMEFSHQIVQLEQMLENLAGQQSADILLAKERADLAKMLGINLDEAATAAENLEETLPDDLPLIDSEDAAATEDAMAQFIEAQKRFHAKLEQVKLDAREKEYAALAEWYSDQLMLAGDNEEAIALVTENYGKQRNDLKEKFRQEDLDAMAAAQDQIEQALLSEEELAIQAETRKWQVLIELAELYGMETIELEKKLQLALAKIRADFDAQELKQKKSLYAQKRGLTQDELDIVVAYYEESAYQMNQFASFASSIHEFMAAVNMESHGVYKGVVMAEMFINQAAAIASGTAAAMKATTWYEALAALGTVISAVTTSITRAQDLFGSAPEPEGYSQPGNVPSYGEGGRFLSEGVSHTHPSGGMPIVDPRSGKVVAFIEKDEGILSKDFMKNNPTLASAALAASKDGRKIEGNFDVGSMRFMNTSAVAQAAGAYSTSTGSPAAPGNASFTVDMTPIREEFALMRKDMNGWSSNLHADLNMRHMSDQMDKYDRLKGMNTVGNGKKFKYKVTRM